MKIKSFLVALSLSGCVTMPVPPQGSLMPPGDAPTTEQMETQLKAYLGRTLKDPGSLQQFKITRAPYHKVWQVNDFSPYRSDWIVCFEYNAKNSYGG